MSINGQEVERVDHATLVAIIQSCPDRIRMIVVFENWLVTKKLNYKFKYFVKYDQNLVVFVRLNYT